MENKEWEEVYRKYYTDEDKDDYYILYLSTKNPNEFRLKMLGIWIQVNMYYKVEENKIKVIRCTHQSAMDDEYIPHEISEQDALKYCEDFEDFIDSFLSKNKKDLF